MSVINTNVNSLVTQNAITKNEKSISLAMTQLSTGSRINSAKDDSAGMAISVKMTSQIRGLNMAVRNANDAISLVQTAEGAVDAVTTMMQRMRELAVQSATDTYSSTDRALMQQEFSALNDEITRTATLTNFNGQQLLQSSEELTFQVGANSGDTILFSTIQLSSVIADISGATVASQGGASAAVTNITAALDTLNEKRATMGAMINRLGYAADNLTNISQNLTQARSRIQDTEYAAATRELARTQIIQQAGMAMLSQANQQPQSVLSLLR
jgi:flagellin